MPLARLERMLRAHYAVAIVFLIAAGAALAAGTTLPREGHPGTPIAMPSTAGTGAAADWFEAVKPFCNAVEAETAVTRFPPPANVDGRGYAAACFALAGRIHRARGFLLDAATDQRWRAAGIVFDVGHPVADAGDDRSAGPIMELVVEFWPNHYMALYHAGAAAAATDRPADARRHLERFLQYYDVQDGWRGSAVALLERLRAR